MIDTESNIIAAGTIPIHPGVMDFADAHGKVILYVKDEEEGRSLYIAFKMYGEISRAYEVRYDDFEQVVTRIMGSVEADVKQDPFTQLLTTGGTE